MKKRSTRGFQQLFKLTSLVHKYMTRLKYSCIKIGDLIPFKIKTFSKSGLKCEVERLLCAQLEYGFLVHDMGFSLLKVLRAKTFQKCSTAIKHFPYHAHNDATCGCSNNAFTIYFYTALMSLLRIYVSKFS